MKNFVKSIIGGIHRKYIHNIMWGEPIRNGKWWKWAWEINV